tara:strand:- start:2235 stop:2594 length:360 start_codon:yes stop_codon:yes gene_type:complete
MSLRSRITKVKNQLHEELDTCNDFYKDIDYSTEFGYLVSYATRIKILKSLINCFRLIKYDRYNEIKIESITKRIKLHLYQLRKLKTQKESYEQNRIFLYDCLQVIVCFISEKIKLCYIK